MDTARPLTNLQREILELFSFEVPEEDLLQIRRLLARYFASRATTAMDRFVEESGLSAEDLEAWAHEHERAATDRP